MLTSLLAHKLVIVKLKLVLNFMNEIINPPCENLLAPLSDFYVRHISEGSVIVLEDINSSPEDTESVIRAAVSLSVFDAPEEKVAGEGGEESSVGGPKRPVCEAMFARRRLVWRQMWWAWTLMLLMALTKLKSLGPSLRDSRFQKSFVERNLQGRECPRVSLTPLTFHIVSFQIFNLYQ